MNAGNPDIDEADYLGVIQRKTAKLFEAAAQLGAVLGAAAPEREAALAAYGLHLGIAFQLVDDVLDYSGDLEDIGKNLGDDLAEGKMTLPLIRAIEVGGREDAAADPQRRHRRPHHRIRPGDGRPRANEGARLHARTRRPRGRCRGGAGRDAPAFAASANSARIGVLCRPADVLNSPSPEEQKTRGNTLSSRRGTA